MLRIWTRPGSLGKPISDLGAAEVLGQSGKLLDVEIAGQFAVGLHLPGVDVEDLDAARFLGQADLDGDLQTAGSEQSIVDHVASVGHTYDENVVELVNAVDLGEELVDDGVVDAGVS